MIIFLQKNFYLKILLIFYIFINLFQFTIVKAFVPYYVVPNEIFLRNNGSFLGRKAYQLLILGRLSEGLQLANLAISLNKEDDILWTILAEAQLRNGLVNDALKSIEKGKLVNPEKADFYFVEGSIYLQKRQLNKAKESLKKGLEIMPTYTFAMFELGNIYLIEKNYTKALKVYKKAIDNNSNYWQVINNMGLIYFEINQIEEAIKCFNKAISIHRNGETLLALAVSLQYENIQKSIELAKEALILNPDFVSSSFREEQLWGGNIQTAVNLLFEEEALKKDIYMAEISKN